MHQCRHTQHQQWRVLGTARCCSLLMAPPSFVLPPIDGPAHSPHLDLALPTHLQSTKIPVPKDPKRAARHAPASPAAKIKMPPGEAAELREGGGSGFATPITGTSPPAGEGLLAPAARLPRVVSSPAKLAPPGAGATGASSARSSPKAPRHAASVPDSPAGGTRGGWPADESASDAAGASPTRRPRAEEASIAGSTAASAGVPVDLPPGLPPLLSADQAINCFITRLGFDALRSPAYQAS